MIWQKLPKLITWYLTEQCNYDCHFCFTKNFFENEQVSELSFAEISDILNDIRATYRFAMRQFEFIFSGGEPFMRDDIFALLELFDEQQIAYRIATNLAMLQEKKIIALAKTKVSFIGVSLHCFSVHEDKNVISYEHIREKLHILRDHNREVKLILCVPVSYLRAESNIKIIQLAQEVSARLNILHMNFTNAECTKAQLAMTHLHLGEPVPSIGLCEDTFDASAVSAFQKNIETLKRLAHQASVPILSFPSLKKRLPEYYLEAIGRGKITCGAKRNELRISSRGIVFPCVQYAFGDLRKESFRNIMTNERTKLFYKVKKKYNYFPTCFHCNKASFKAV